VRDLVSKEEKQSMEADGLKERVKQMQLRAVDR